VDKTGRGEDLSGWSPEEKHERHKAQTRAMNRARKRAVAQLVKENPERYFELYAMCAAVEDPPVTARPPKEAAVEEIEAQIEKLRRRLDRARAEQVGSGGEGGG